LFGLFDDAERQAILDRTPRVERFDLGLQIDPGGRQLVQAHYRRVANRLQNAVVTASHVEYPPMHSGSSALASYPDSPADYGFNPAALFSVLEFDGGLPAPVDR